MSKALVISSDDNDDDRDHDQYVVDSDRQQRALPPQ